MLSGSVLRCSPPHLTFLCKEGTERREKLCILPCTQTLLRVICCSYSVPFFFFFNLDFKETFSNTHFSGLGARKLPTQVCITLSKIKMWRTGIYTADWEHRNPFLDHISLPTLSTDSSEPQAICWRSDHTQPLPFSQHKSFQWPLLPAIPAWVQVVHFSSSFWIFNSSAMLPEPVPSPGSAPLSTA